MTEHVTPSVVTDDTPRAVSLTARQSTIAVAERDMSLLVAAVAAVLTGADAPTLSTEDHARLRRLNTLLFRELSDRGQNEVRQRTSRPATSLQRTA